MKTVCPHCHQKYDVPDDYLQQDVTCQKCEKDFTVTKAKFCSECGKANPAQVFQCYSCQRPFLLETGVSSPRTEQKQVSADRSETIELATENHCFYFWNRKWSFHSARNWNGYLRVLRLSRIRQ